jgi:hypothetical protein
MPRTFASIASIASLLLLANLATAQFIDWDSGSFDGSWHNAANWNAVPSRIPNADDTARIGNLPIAANELVILTANAVAQAIELTSGADLDNNGYVLDSGSDLTLGGVGSDESELIVRPVNVGGPISVAAHDVHLFHNGQVTMRGGVLELAGNIFDGGVLALNPGAELVGFGTLLFTSAAGIDNNGTIFVRDPTPNLGEPTARTLEFQTVAPIIGSFALGTVDVGRNSTLRYNLASAVSDFADELILRGNSTFDMGINSGDMLSSGGFITVNSGAVPLGGGSLPATPAVIRGDGEFLLEDAEIRLNAADEVLAFDVFFRQDDGMLVNDGTIRFRAGADLSAAATFDTGNFGQLVNAESSTLNLADGADIDSPLVNHGTLTIDAAAEGLATLDALTLSDTSSLEIGLRTVVPGQFDALTVEGNLVLDGTLVVVPNPAFSALPGNSFPILTSNFGIISGTFDDAVLPIVDGLTFEITYLNPQTVVLRVVEVLPGDYNDDGTVDAADYTLWRDQLGAAASLPNDDTPGVGEDDYTRWKANFGQPGPGAGSLANVPEPASLTLLSLALWLVTATRRRPCPSNR